MDFNFYMPVKVVSGAGALNRCACEMKTLGDRCLVVTGAHSAQKSGALDDLTAALKEQEIEVAVYSKIAENPLLTACEEAGRLALAKNAQFIVGVGGGSPLDAAKVIAVLTANPGLNKEALFQKEWKQQPLPVVLIGTTAGTGSEVSPTAVITGPDGVKRGITHPDLYGKLSVADPRYTYSMPDSTTVSTGLDAFCHAVEGYFSPSCGDMATYLAEKAMPMIYEGLKQMTPSMKVTEAFREEMYYGSLWAGMVLNANGTSFPHPFGYVLTENHGIPHGKACAAFLPSFLLHCARHAPERMERFLKVLHADLPEVNDLLNSLSGVSAIAMTQEEIDSYRRRFTGLKHYKSTPGGYSMEEGIRLFESLFLRS